MSTKTKTVMRNLHRIGGGVAFVLIASFWLATIVVELVGTPDQIAMVKSAIVWGLILLVPALAATGGSGFRLVRAKPGGHVGGVPGVKLRRMKLIAANGILVLVPCALVLMMRANAGQFDAVFATLQAVELVAGLINLILIGLNIRDGMRLARPTRPRMHADLRSAQ